MASLHDVEFRLTGGASNTDPAGSYGGAMSTVAGGVILSQSSGSLTTLTGITINDVYGCNEGTATWTYTAATTSLTFQPPGGTVGTAVNIGTTGEYVIQGAGSGVVGTALITVDQALLPGSNITNTTTISNLFNKVFADVSKDDSDSGKTIYRLVAIKNAHSTDKMKGVKIWVHENTPGQDTINLGKASAKNIAPPAQVNDYTLPKQDGNGLTDMTFGDYPSETTALSIGDLNAGDYHVIGLRQTIPAGVTEATLENTFKLGVYVRV